MGLFFVYILKSSACLVLFYLFYKLLLSKDTFHRFNRIALLGVVLFSVGLPFIQLQTRNPVVVQRSMEDLEKLFLLAQHISVETPAQSQTPVWIYALLGIYGAGVAFFAFRFLYSLFQIFRLIRKEEKQVLENGVILILTNYKISPFSWMNYILISREDWQDGSREILTHEMGHIRLRHSWDILVVSLATIFHWFNPAAWLLKQELQNIHEFEADENVLEQGIDAKKYQLLLIKKAVGSQRFTSMANSFSHSKLKKRITMMLKSKSNPWARLKYVYVLPLAVLVVTAFARPEVSSELEKLSTVKISEIIPQKEIIDVKPVKDTPPLQGAPTPPPGIENMLLFLNDQEITPEEFMALGNEEIASMNVCVGEDATKGYDLKGKNGILFTYTKDSKISEGLSEEDKKKLEKELAAIDKKLHTMHIQLDKELADLDVRLQETLDTLLNTHMKEVEVTLQHEILQSDIEAKVEQAMRESNIEQQIELAIQQANIDEKVKEAMKEAELSMAQLEKEREILHVKKVRLTAKDWDCLVIVDGVEVTTEVLDNMDPSDIDSMQVYKGGDAVSRYGEKAESGVIIIKTRKY